MARISVSPAVAGEMVRKRTRRPWWRDLLGPRVAPYLFVSPFFLMFIIFFVFPVIWSMMLSFQKWTAAETIWVGLANYRFVLRLPSTRIAFENIVWYAIVNNVVQIIFALSLAVLIDLPFMRRLSGALRLAYFSPHVASGVTTAILFAIILGGGGFSDRLLSMAGIKISWLYSTEWAKPAVIFAGAWRWIGYWIVIFMAGLQGIPDEYYESAELDGATLWERFWYITFPSLRPVFLFVLVVNTMGTLQIFEEPYMLFGNATRGGPLGSATTPVLEMYKLGFENFDLGSAAALGWLLAVVVVMVSIAQFKLGQERGGTE